MGYTRRALLYLLVATAVALAVTWLFSGQAELAKPLQLGLAVACAVALAGCLLSALAGRFFALAAGSGVVAYAAVRLALAADGSPALVPIGFAIAVEAALILCLAWLARRVVIGVKRLEESLALEAVPEFSPLAEQSGLMQGFADHQFQIAMRHGRSLSAIVLQLSPESSQRAQRPPAGEFGRLVTRLHELGKLAQLTAQTFRRTDIAMKAEGHRKLVLVCPETGPEGALLLAEKIRAAAEENLGQVVDCGFASFPNEALNLEELVHQANSKLGQQDESTAKRHRSGNGRG